MLTLIFHARMLGFPRHLMDSSFPMFVPAYLNSEIASVPFSVGVIMIIEEVRP